MGVKRPFGDEEFQELPFKQARQVDYSNKLTQFEDGVPHNSGPPKPDSLGDNNRNAVNFHSQDLHRTDMAMGISNLANNLETPLPLITSSSGDEEDIGDGPEAYEEDAVYEAGADSSLSQYLDFDFPPRRSLPFKNVYSSYLDRPRKLVPVGPDHQATIPLCSMDIKKKKLERLETSNLSHSPLVSGSDDAHRDKEEKQMGTCIIPMPVLESSANISDVAGGGRIDCCCLDEGSIRCVRQHVMEAREKLRKSLGDEKFENLGFDEMGEEVAHKWSEEEQRVFHAVIYSNPASLGHNFLEHLAQVFPTRSTKEIVSYYFNVFMLRRRAAQNRSAFLDIDSDDDEFQGPTRGPYKVSVPEEDEDSAIESPRDQYDHDNQGVDSLAEDDDEDEDEDDDDDDDDGDSGANGDVGDGSGDATGEDSGIDYASEPLDENSHGVNKCDPNGVYADKNTGTVMEDFTVQDDSCMSFEFQADNVHSSGSDDAGAALAVSGVKSDHNNGLPGNGCNDVLAKAFLLDPYETKVWDARYGSPIKGIDLLPTCNIIEEIFGKGSCDN